MGEFVSFID